MTSLYPRALVWLRRDLRLEDHAALYHALNAADEVVVGFIFDRTILDRLPAADRRVEFIWETIAALKADLNERGSDVVVRYDHAVNAIPTLAKELNVQAVFCANDYEPAALARDAAVAEALAVAGIAWHSVKDHVVFERDEILTATGTMFSVFSPYKRAWLKQLTPAHTASYHNENLWHRLAQRPVEPLIGLSDMGFSRTNLHDLRILAGPGGAEARLRDFLPRMDHYKITRDFPGQKGVSYLSVHLRFGTVSIRRLVALAMQETTDGAASWLSELIWREFYQQILWHRPDVVDHSFKPEYRDLAFPNDTALFTAWCEGQTGYPLVDAAMRQLNQTGYMHNRLRMVAASFLVKDLLVDWRWGEEYFAEKLLDFDLAANNGGWQWSASTGCDAQPYFRIFNPILQSLKFDPDGAFIRRYVPELKEMVAPGIHAPWQAMALDLRAAGVVLGETYPHPIVDHATRRDQALSLFKVKA